MSSLFKPPRLPLPLGAGRLFWLELSHLSFFHCFSLEGSEEELREDGEEDGEEDDEDDEARDGEGTNLSCDHD